MPLAALRETVTVSGASPVIDLENTKVGARLDSEILNAVPTSRSIFGSTTILPGMVMARQDPGGLNAATSTNMVAHGATNYNLNYYGVTADTPQDYGSMYYVDCGSAEDLGRYRGHGRGNRRRRRRKHQHHPEIRRQPDQGRRLVQHHRPRILGWLHRQQHHARAAGSGHPGSDAAEAERLQCEARQPFIRDRLWWFASFRNYSTVEATPGYTTGNADGSLTNPFDSNLRNYGEHSIPDDEEQSALRILDVQPQSPAAQERRRDATRPATIDQASPKDLVNVNFQSVISSNTFLEVSSSYFHMHWPSAIPRSSTRCPTPRRPRRCRT